MKCAYVYVHKKVSNGEVFYVGVGDYYGRQSYKRANSKTQRTDHWKRLVSKYGYAIEIIADDLEYDEARTLEIYLISFYGRLDKKKGNLINKTNGGDGIKGLVWTDEHKKKVGDANRGKPNYFKGKKRPGNTVALQGNSHSLGKKLNIPPDVKLRQSEFRRGNTYATKLKGTTKPPRLQSHTNNHRAAMIAKGYWKAAV